MDTNLLYALIVAPILFAVIAFIVVYSCKQHQKNLRQTSNQVAGAAGGA